MSADLDIIDRLKTVVDESGINENRFFRSFQAAPLDKDELATAFQQYYYYIRTFPQILAGLSHRVDSEEVRLELAKTVVSELGQGHGPAHFQMFESLMQSVGITLDDYRTVDHIPEAEALVDGLRAMFLEGPTDRAVGGHYTIEETGLPMIKALYEGFRHQDGVTTESLGYFYLHLFLEADHVSWISDAVRHVADDPARARDVEEGAAEVAGLLSQFWEGLCRITYDRHPAAVGAGVAG